MGAVFEHLEIWDYLTFLTLAVVVVGGLGVAVFILGLPGRIAIARNHPDAEAVRLMGLLGFLAVVPWFQALLWAFKPAVIVDIRRSPEEEQRDIRKEIARLAGKQPAAPPTESKGTSPPIANEK